MDDLIPGPFEIRHWHIYSLYQYLVVCSSIKLVLFQASKIQDNRVLQACILSWRWSGHQEEECAQHLGLNNQTRIMGTSALFQDCIDSGRPYKLPPPSSPPSLRYLGSGIMDHAMKEDTALQD